VVNEQGSLLRCSDCILVLMHPASTESLALLAKEAGIPLSVWCQAAKLKNNLLLAMAVLIWRKGCMLFLSFW